MSSSPVVSNPEPHSRWLWRALALAACITGVAAIVSTYRAFNHTNDEIAHLAAGMEWLSKGRFTYEAQHPPLGRVAAAIGPYLAGERSTGAYSMWIEGRAILGRGEHYVRTLALSRLGELPFFLVVCGIVWLWGRRLLGEAGGALSVLFVATNPSVLAHAGLSTTDIAPTAMYPIALYCYSRWLDRPAWRESILLGIALALAAVSKFSAIAFLGAAFVLVFAARAVLLRKWRLEGASDGPRLRTAEATTVAVAALVIFAVYRFDVGPVSPEWTLQLPAPSFFRGIFEFVMHGTMGHKSYLLGQLKSNGWWYYFPVALIVKTPLPLLLFGGIGIAAIVQRIRDTDRQYAWEMSIPMVGAATVLLVAMTSKVNIGIRHVLPLYPLLAIVAAHGALVAWRWSQARRPLPLRTAPVALAALVIVAVVPVVRAHPDHLAYFNPIAGRHPERVLVDSNLDWGQDLYRLADEMKRRGITSIRLAYFGTAEPGAAGVMGASALSPHERANGWIAASETYLSGEWVETAYDWLLPYEPVAHIGKSMRLYYIAPVAQEAGRPRAATPP